MNTEDLIVSLAADARPTKVLPPFEMRAGRWLLVAVTSSVALALVFGLRRDLAAVVFAPSFLLLGVLMFFVAIGAGASALSLSVPGTASRVTSALPMVLLLLWIAWLVAAALTSGASVAAIYHEPWHWACIVRVSLLSVIPSAALFFAVRRGYVMDRASSAFASAVAGGAFAALALQFVCPVDRGAHLLASHLAPVLVLSMGAAVVQFVASRRS